MKASELRIGNFVGLNLKEFPENYFTVFEVANSNMVVQDGLTPHGFRDLSYFDAELLEPIPLTEEWLLKFGFVDDNGSFYKIPVGGSELFINPENGMVVWIERNNNVFNNPALIEYVHQLQNLYFALTGEELYLR